MKLELKQFTKRAMLFFFTIGLAIGLLFLVIVNQLYGQLPAPLGPYANVGWPITTLSAQTPTLTAQQMIGEVITTFAGATTMTTDTAANICALFPAYAFQNSGAGFAYDWYVKSAAGNTNVIPTAGTGVTIVGTGTNAASTVRHWKIVLVTCPLPGTSAPTAAVTMHSLETTLF